MAGIFTSQNKVRPGAYTVFKAVSNQAITPSNRGIVTLPMDLPWGDTSRLIEVTAADFSGDAVLSKVGLSNTAKEIQPLREALKNASKALVGRLNANPVKATAVVNLGTEADPINATLVAAYGGTLGNNIVVACVENTIAQTLELVTTVSDREVDRQVVRKVSDYKPNGWFSISVSLDTDPEFKVFAGISLGSDTAGTNGSEVVAADYSEYLSKSAQETWNTIAITHKTMLPGATVKTFIEGLRENLGLKVQAVVYDYSDANYEGIISVDQGYMLGDEEVPVESFIAYVAGVSAGASITQSNTYHVVPGATSIIGAKSPEEIEVGLQAGKMMLSYRQDRTVVIEKDINTLHSYSADRNYAFSKNRVIRCLDDISSSITRTFENTFIGKVDNTENGRTLFKGAVLGYLNSLQDQGAIQNFTAATDVEVTVGNDIESIVCNVAVQPVDSMEKLYMTVVVS